MSNTTTTASTMKHFESLSMLESFLLASKKIAEHEAKIAIYKKIVTETMQGINRLESDSKKSLKRVRDDALHHTPPPSDDNVAKKSKPFKRAFSLEKCLVYRNDYTLLKTERVTRNEMTKICRLLSKGALSYDEIYKWKIDEKTHYIKTNEVPDRPLVVDITDPTRNDVVELSDTDESEDDFTDYPSPNKVTGNMLNAIAFGMDKEHDKRQQDLEHLF